MNTFYSLFAIDTPKNQFSSSTFGAEFVDTFGIAPCGGS